MKPAKESITSGELADFYSTYKELKLELIGTWLWISGNFYSTYKELKHKYLDGQPCFYSDGEILRFWTEQDSPCFIARDTVVSRNRWNKILLVLKKAGERLRQLNREKKWHGSVVVKI